MLDFFNKKYETVPSEPALPPADPQPEPITPPSITTTPSSTPSISPSLVDIDISGPPVAKVSDDTTALEVQWGLTSSSSSEEEEKTQISKAEKPLVVAGSNHINLELTSTDDEVGLTELDTDAENTDAVSILPDASQSTFADHEDRAEFLNHEMPTDIGKTF